jgi:hypothetical protein
MREIYESEHHRIPQNGVDIRGTNDPRNRMILPHNRHVNWHSVFGNLEFHYQILKVLEMSSPVVQQRIKKEVSQIVTQDPQFVYEN